MKPWKDDIITALTNLGGTAAYGDLYQEIARIRGSALPSSWKKTVQRTIQDHAVESDGFKRERLFFPVDGMGSGKWGLIQSQASKTAISSMEAPVDDLPVDRPVRNAAWSRDELILALDLYLRFRASPPGKHSDEVIELSEFLNLMGQAVGQAANGTYRNPNGVYMKLMNFRRFDPTYTSSGKVGLERGNRDEELVWQEFSGDLERLRSVVGAIRQAITNDHSGDLQGMDEPDICEAEEGKVLTRLHRIRERSRTLVEECKRAAMKRHGKLSCEACGFDFSLKYGEIGVGIIEVHHKKPVHTLKPGDTTKLQDLALLCANCHRVVHSRRRWLSVDEVRAAIQQ